MFLLISLLTLVNCGDNTTKTTTSVAETSVKQTTEISAKIIEGFRYSDYILSTDAEQAVSNWTNFTELSKQIGYLKTADFTFYKDDIETLKVFINELYTTLPEALNTNPIKARLKVVETKLLQLNNNLTLDNISKDEKRVSIKALLVAMSNLNNRINKKLEFDVTDVGRPE